ncbi:MAG TPA: 2,3-epoxybenzoyl-CoA dihydrolase [Actinomycetes bacterium]|nr:2,3-epoxybenzoyl-CoA dihydrolase [Actinomycetes bacterium]
MSTVETTAAAGPGERAWISFDTHPGRYRHWRLRLDGPVATLALDADEDGGLQPGYALKLNSYDLAVDIELYDAVQRLRFEHPEVRAVVLTSAKEGVFCAGANIKMLAQASHPLKVNFCKFTNETRLAIEEASACSGQVYLAAVNGTASGGGYELALAAERILLVDDGSSAVSLPEVPLLGVLPGTGGLTRLTDKRKVRRDRADFVCTVAEGVRGRRALEWGLVDELVPRSRLPQVARERAAAVAAGSDRPPGAAGVELTPLERDLAQDRVTYPHLVVELDRSLGVAAFTVRGPGPTQPDGPEAVRALGARWWPLAVARELDDAILLLRFNELELGTWVLRTEGDPEAVAAVDATLLAHADHWLVREVILYLKRTLKRLDLSSRSLVALVEPGSCFAGTLLELVLAADRSFMLEGELEGAGRPPASILLTGMNFGPLPAAGGRSRLESRFPDQPELLEAVAARRGEPLRAAETCELGLVTFAYDEIDWEDEVRLALEERASLSPDALSGMEASLRFGGPETLETKIFGRLSAWQNWTFQRPNAAGQKGALRRFGTGQRPRFDRRRV